MQVPSSFITFEDCRSEQLETKSKACIFLLNGCGHFYGSCITAELHFFLNDLRIRLEDVSCTEL